MAISGFVPQATVLATIPPVLVFAGVAQFIGGLLALRRGNAFAGTAFCAYGANNAVVATFLLMQALGILPNTPGSPVQQMLALELYCFAYISLVFAVIAVRLNAAFVAILLPLVPGFTLAGMANWYGPALPAVWGHIGGYCLIASAAVAAYTATAMVLNSTWRQPVLPLFSSMPNLQTRDTARAARALRAVGDDWDERGTARSTSDPATGPTRLQTDTRTMPPRTDPGATDDTFGPEQE